MKYTTMSEAKAKLSRLISATERGEPTTIMKCGKPAAVLIPVEDAMKLYPNRDDDFVKHLLAFPGGLDFPRDESPVRDMDLANLDRVPDCTTSGSGEARGAPQRTASGRAKASSRKACMSGG